MEHVAHQGERFPVSLPDRARNVAQLEELTMTASEEAAALRREFVDLREGRRDFGMDTIRVHQRLDQARFTEAQQQAFRGAVEQMVADGTYGDLVAIHAEMRHNMHGVMHGVFNPIGLLRFLPWHRRFLLAFEEALREADRRLRPGTADNSPLTIPYWRWPDPFPAWLDGFLPETLPDGTQPPPRVLAPPSDKPTNDDVTRIITRFQAQLPANNVNGYIRFTYALEGYGVRRDGSPLPAHNSVHNWVGGIMANAMLSPTDPIFWLHHAEVDRLWHIWQTSHEDLHPPLTGDDRVMDPWPETYDDLLDLTPLGYSYDSDEPTLEPPVD